MVWYEKNSIREQKRKNTSREAKITRSGFQILSKRPAYIRIQVLPPPRCFLKYPPICPSRNLASPSECSPRPPQKNTLLGTDYSFPTPTLSIGGVKGSYPPIFNLPIVGVIEFSPVGVLSLEPPTDTDGDRLVSIDTT